MVRFKILERITLDSFITIDDIKEIIIAYCKEDNEYYLLEDPIIISRFNKVDDEHYETNIKHTIVEIDTKGELLKRYMSYFIKNRPNPFKYLMLYRENGNIGIKSVDQLLANITIPDDIINQLNMYLEAKRKKIIINIEFLEGLEALYRLYNNEKAIFDRLKIDFLTLVKRFVHESNDYVIYADNELMLAITEELIQKEKRALEKESTISNRGLISTNKESIGSNTVVTHTLDIGNYTQNDNELIIKIECSLNEEDKRELAKLVIEFFKSRGKSCYVIFK